LSMAVVSKPATGKKIMSDLAQLYAPISQLIQPTLVTLAGLGASVHQRAGGWVAKRGVLPNCHGGVAIIEDTHRLSPRILRDVQGCLLGVAEDGLTVQTKVASSRFVAETALHLNMNLHSVVHARLREPGMSGKIKDI